MSDEKVYNDDQKIEELLTRRIGSFEGRSNIWPSKEEAKKKLKENKGLRIYLGIDPTGSDLHLGHVVPLLFLKQLLELGHIPVLVIGDFTARIGDPSGKDTTRKPLAEEEIKNNFNGYLGQVYKILPESSIEIMYNSSWLDRLTIKDFFQLASQVTVQQMIQRSMFQERIEKDKPFAVHEFLYPLMQGYDSVAMNIDGEVGGIDQMFNMRMGRDLMKKLLGKEKLVFGTRLVEDPITGKKMSKSGGEVIAINDEPSEIRRKILALGDSMTKIIFELCTDESLDRISDKEKALSGREYKELLAGKLIEMFRGKEKIKEAQAPKEGKATGNLAVTIKDLGFASSISEAKKLITSNAVEINGQVKTDWNYQLQKGDKLKVGKGRFGLII